jgi:hypothetical protein
MDGFSSNLRWTYYTSQQVARATFMFTHRAHAYERTCASVVKYSIIFGRILFKFDGHILHMTTSYMGYILNMIKHRMHACVCKRACASARVIKHSLISERILSKFGVNIQQISRRYMSYLICVWMHVLTACTSIHSQICKARDGQWLVVTVNCKRVKYEVQMTFTLTMAKGRESVKM